MHVTLVGRMKRKPLEDMPPEIRVAKDCTTGIVLFGISKREREKATSSRVPAKASSTREEIGFVELHILSTLHRTLWVTELPGNAFVLVIAYQ